MSHELQYPELINDPFYEWEYGYQETYPFFFVPEIPKGIEEIYKGISYANVNYTWDELEYRMNVDYSSVPEPSAIGVIMGLALLTLIILKSLLKKRI